MASMLEYVKMILRKVSFDRSLFEKELRKALVGLAGQEVEALRVWCFATFSGRYRTILTRCFRTALAQG